MTKKDLTIQKVMNEQNQTHETRKRLYLSLEKLLQMPVISYFTSFNFVTSKPELSQQQQERSNR